MHEALGALGVAGAYRSMAGALLEPSRRTMAVVIFAVQVHRQVGMVSRYEASGR